MPLKEIKKAYFHKAKKYHPDLNPDDDKAQKMFLQIQSAYRTIESEKDPSIRARRDAEYMDYDKTDESSNFKSRRGSKARDKAEDDDYNKKKAHGFNDDAKAYKHEYTTNYDYQEERFLRRYRYQHLFSKSNVPMSIRNFDRHGMANLAQEETKPLDRFHIPAWLIWGVFTMLVLGLSFQYSNDKGMNIEQLQRENMLKAMKAQQDELKYDTKKEITPTEQVEMKSQ